MKANNIIRYIFSFLIFVLLHVVFVKYFIFFDVAVCLLYVGFIMMLPMTLPIPILLLLSFLTGLFVDLFYDTAGVHAASCVAIMYLRPRIVALLTPLGGYDEIADLSINAMGIRWFIIFTLLFTFVHLTFVFMLEAFSFSYFYWTMLKVITSTLFSSFMIIVFQFLVFTKLSK